MLKKLIAVNLDNESREMFDLTEFSESEVRALLNESAGGKLFVFLSEQRNEKAVILCPGGGFKQVNMQHEGFDYAKWFADQNITLAVLKYNLPEGHKKSPVTDIASACRVMRAGIENEKYEKLGCMGTSIGGYMAAYAAVNGLVDFQILMYSVVSMEDSLTHKPSRLRMFGSDPFPEEAKAWSLQYRVDENTVPAFIVASEDDPAVMPENSLIYASALMKNKIPFSLHIYPSGGHSFGFKDDYPYKNAYLSELRQWLCNR
ncbi:MAG: alpha/beta hydrolase [Paludibacter sp.]|nr:alpha/beta hydrolase [Paludibacter sp.]